jgi:hypothetical protein
MKLLILDTVVVIGLGILLLTKSARFTVGTYRIAFIVGIASFCLFLLGPGGQWDFRVGTNAAFGKLVLVPLFLIGTSPFVLLLESGLVGYRCFSSWMKYVSMGLTIVGALGVGIPLFVSTLRMMMRR